MKKIAILLGVGLSLGACHTRQKPKRMAIPTANEAAAQQPKAKAVGNAQVEIHIEGMKCAMGCARKIEQALNQTAGVSLAKVNFKAKEATIAYDSLLTNTEKLAQVISGAGHYEVKGITKL